MHSSSRRPRLLPRGLASLLLPSLLLLAPLGPEVRGGPVWGLAAQQPQRAVDLVGSVVDARDGRPVVGAVVRVPELNRYTLSGEDGRFTLRNVPPGEQVVLVHRLGYGERGFRIQLREGGFYGLELEPDPILLDGVEAVAGEDPARRILDSAARTRATGVGVRGPPVFWSAWDRDAIEASGIDDTRTFLTRGPPRLVIRPCVGLGLPADRLCVSPPFGGMRLGGTGTGASGLAAGAGRRVPVFLDDRPLGALEELDTFTMELVHRVETYGDRGEQGIRLYTEGYLRLVAEGLVQPGSPGGAPELFDDLVRERARLGLPDLTPPGPPDRPGRRLTPPE